MCKQKRKSVLWLVDAFLKPLFWLRDALERVAGVPAEKIVEAHGTLHTSHCINSECCKEYDREWMTGLKQLFLITFTQPNLLEHLTTYQL